MIGRLRLTIGANQRDEAPLDPIEKAIRTALERGDADDRQFRERIYRSVGAALDRAIQANPQLTVEKAIARRKGLQAKIAEIESEFQPARSDDDAALDAALLDILDAPFDPPQPPRAEREIAWPDEAPPRPAAPREPPPVEIDSPPPADRAGRHPEPEVDLGVLPEPPGNADPSVDFPAVVPPALDHADISAPVPDAPPRIAAADRAGRRSEKRRPFAAALLGAAVLVLLAGGLLYAIQAGLLKFPAGRGVTAQDTPATEPDEDFSPAPVGTSSLGAESGAEQKWVTIFTPANPATIGTPADAKAEVMQGDNGGFLRIRSGASGSAISFDVGPGVLQQLAGHKAVFNVTARGADGQGTEMSIECNFGDLGNCGRKRYEVGYEKAEFLFDLQMPDKQAGADGTIAINSDFAGKGRALDIFEIRVSAQ